MKTTFNYMTVCAALFASFFVPLQLSNGSALAQDDFKLPPIQVKTTTAKVIEVRVKEVQDDSDQTIREVSVLIGRGSSSGVAVGDQFSILREERKIGEIRVSVVYVDVAVGTVLRSKKDIQNGDLVVLSRRNTKPLKKSKPGSSKSDRASQSKGKALKATEQKSIKTTKQRKEAQGVIESLSEDEQTALVTIGGNHGLRVGDELTVYNEDRLAYARLKVMAVKAGSSTARLLSAQIGGLESIDSDLKVGLVVRFIPKLSLNDLTAEQLRKRSQRYAERAAALQKEANKLRAESKRLLRLAKQKMEERQQEIAAESKSEVNKVRKGQYVRRLEIWVQDVKDSAGAEIVDTKLRGIGARMGLKVGDLIYEVDGELVDNSSQLLKIFRKRKSGIQIGVVSEAGSTRFWVKAKK